VHIPGQNYFMDTFIFGGDWSVEKGELEALKIKALINYKMVYAMADRSGLKITCRSRGYMNFRRPFMAGT
jgi:hypothetical protein